MPSNRKLPDIAPCPRPGCNGPVAVQSLGLRDRQVVCFCHWAGPIRKSERAAILAWNRRSDAEAERRGAEKAAEWMRFKGFTLWAQAMDQGRGEVGTGEAMTRPLLVFAAFAVASCSEAT